MRRRSSSLLFDGCLLRLLDDLWVRLRSRFTVLVVVLLLVTFWLAVTYRSILARWIVVGKTLLPGFFMLLLLLLLVLVDVYGLLSLADWEVATYAELFD